MNRHFYSIDPVGWREETVINVGCKKRLGMGVGGSQLYGLERINSKDHRGRTADGEKTESNWKNRR